MNPRSTSVWLHLPLISANLTKPLIHDTIEREPASARALVHQHQRVVDRLRQIEVGEIEFHPAGLDLLQIEDVVDQRQQMLARGEDVVRSSCDMLARNSDLCWLARTAMVHLYSAAAKH